MKKGILSATGFVVALGLISSPAFAASAPKVKPVSHQAAPLPMVKPAPHETKAVPEVKPASHVTKPVPKVKPAPHVTKSVPKAPAKPKPIPASKVKDAQKFLEPVNKNILKVTSAVQQLVKQVSAFNSTDVPTELAFYQNALNKLNSESKQLDSLSKQVNQISKKDGNTADVTKTNALISTAKTSITNEIGAVNDLITKVTAVAPTTTTEPTTSTGSTTTTGSTSTTGSTTSTDPTTSTGSASSTGSTTTVAS